MVNRELGQAPHAVATLMMCPGCGLQTHDTDGPTHAYLGASAGCWAAWGELQAQLMDVWGVGRWSSMAIDAYAAQHPGVSGRRQAQSVTIHLVSLAMALEHGWDAAGVTAAKQAFLRDDPVFPWLEPPASLGEVTVADLLAASPGASDAVIERWAGSVWDAWAPHHAAIEVHVAKAMACLERRTSRRRRDLA